MTVYQFACIRRFETVAAKVTPAVAVAIVCNHCYPPRGRVLCRCGSRRVVAADRLGDFNCRDCGRRFSIRTTPRVEIRLLLLAIWSVAIGRDLVTPRELAAATGVAPATAGRVLASVRRKAR